MFGFVLRSASLSEVFLCERSAGMRFYVFLERKCLIVRAECNGCLNSPRTVFGRMRTAAFVVFFEAGFEVVCKARVVSFGLVTTLQHVDVIVLIHGLPRRSSERSISLKHRRPGFALRASAYVRGLRPDKSPWQSSFIAPL